MFPYLLAPSPGFHIFLAGTKKLGSHLSGRKRTPPLSPPRDRPQRDRSWSADETSLSPASQLPGMRMVVLLFSFHLPGALMADRSRKNALQHCVSEVRPCSRS